MVVSFLYVCLADAGADLLVAETMMTLDETMAAVEAAHAVCGAASSDNIRP